MPIRSTPFPQFSRGPGILRQIHSNAWQFPVATTPILEETPQDSGASAFTTMLEEVPQDSGASFRIRFRLRMADLSVPDQNNHRISPPLKGTLRVAAPLPSFSPNILYQIRHLINDKTIHSPDELFRRLKDFPHLGPRLRSIVLQVESSYQNQALENREWRFVLKQGARWYSDLTLWLKPFILSPRDRKCPARHLIVQLRTPTVECSESRHLQSASLTSWQGWGPLRNRVIAFTSLEKAFPSESKPRPEDLAPQLVSDAFRLLDQHDPGNEVSEIQVNSVSAKLNYNDRRYNYRRSRLSPQGDVVDKHLHRAFVAFGSNIGDRIKNIETALDRMRQKGLRIIRTSNVYQTAAMYVTDQGAFLNGVCEVETESSPRTLLKTLQSIEQEMGRKKTLENGPRNIDLDILLFDSLVVSYPELILPHPRITERDFVLFPLCDLIPEQGLPEPLPNFSFHYYRQKLRPRPGFSPIQTVPLSTTTPGLIPLEANRSTQIMAILNLTPDSFSDGGLHSSEDLGALTSTVLKFVSVGATIIDVGGQSTRPGATLLSEQEEIARVVPAIKYIRSLPQMSHVAISIDTFRSKVAEAAVEAGADIINDVSAGTMDEEMFSTVARLKKTIVLMHMRGTPETMNRLTDYPKGVINGIGQELLSRVDAAQAAGIPRWRIILDPGIGFAKNQEQNLQILRNLGALRHYKGLERYPWLIGTSRKNFIGRITGVQTPSERTWGTAVAVTEAVRGGADIVRVHDVDEMVKVVRMADAIWRVEDVTTERTE